MISNRRGNMPFAVIAVTLLLLSLVCGAAAANYERAADTADDIRRDSEAVDRASAGIERHLDRGLGEIILEISGDPEAGGMEQRSKAFDILAESWIGNQFPIADSGVRAELISYDIGLRAESMLNVGDDPVTGGHVPAYIKGVGTVKVRMHVGSGETVRDLEVSTDGSYALPLAAEQGSLFENMSKDGGISVSQMMEYQLSCLAQYRVVNGYGCNNMYGGKATGDILTKKDVLDAYRNALTAVSLICFRDPDGHLDMNSDTDLADYLIQKDGKLELDFSAFFAQSLYGIIDRIALQWFEYFCGDRVANELLKPIQDLIEVGKSLKAVLTGHEFFGAQSYIREAMERSGTATEGWESVGGGWSHMRFLGRNIYVQNPVVNVTELDWIKNFRLTQRLESNFVLDTMADILRDASVKASGGKGIRTVVLDPHDPESFAETLSKAFNGQIDSFRHDFGNAVKGAVKNPQINDPFCIEIADAFATRSSEFMDMEAFRTNLKAELADVFADRQNNSYYHPDNLINNSRLGFLEDQYLEKVQSDLARFDVLRNQPGNSSIVKDIMSGIAAAGLDKLGVLAPVDEALQDVVGEMARSVSVNPHSGIVEISGKDSFRLQDGDGNVTNERLNVTFDSDPVVMMPHWDPSLSVHRIGFDRDVCAAYSTTFVVELRDTVGYTVDGSGALADSVGVTTAVMKGSFTNNIRLEIPVVSAWGLDGVRYEGSTNIVNDAVQKVTEFLEPILEPLRKAVAMIREAMTMAVERLVELGRCTAQALEEVYRAVMEPLNDLYNWIYDKFSGYLAEKSIDIYNYIKATGQGMHIGFMGYTLKFDTDAATWAENTKSLVKVSLEGTVAGMGFDAGLEFKCRGDVRAENIGIAGFGKLEGGDWSLKAHVDPVMRFSKHVMTMDGTVGDTKVSMIMPDLVDYHEIGVTLSDVPGVGRMLSNIPLPFLGAKASFDAGLSLKYSDPEKKGLIVNEFECDPSGPDAGNEWIELFNNSPSTLDLKGYTLYASSDWKKKSMPLVGSISPGEYLVVEPSFQLVNESGKYTKKGEAIVIKDPEGDIVDRTPTLRDNKNDANTWHREGDGSMDWTFGEPTMGASNRSSGHDGLLPASALAGIAMDAAVESLDEIGTIDDTASCQEFMRSVVARTVEGVIDHVTGSIVDASVFVSLDLKDVTGSASAGMRIALRAESGLVEETLKYIAGQLQSVLLKCEDPYSIDPVAMFAENIGLDLTFSTGIGMPDFIPKGLTDTSGLDLGITFRTNIAAMTHLAGTDTGRPEAEFGIRLLDCPYLLIPERMKANENMDHDLWLMKTVVTWA